MKNQGVLVLSGSQIKSLMSLQDYMDGVQNAFLMLAENKITGSGVLDIPGNGGVFHIKAAGMYMADELYVAVKVNGNFPENRNRHGLPTIQGAILLCDGIRGNPLAIFDSIEITKQRTAAATAIAARYLARKNSTSVTICGCGLQGRIQLLALKQIFPISRIFAFDQDREICATFCAEMQKEAGIPINAISQVNDGSSQSDIIVTCTTSRRFILKKNDVRAGAFIAAVGADSHDKQEIDPVLLSSSKVVTDITDQCVQIGDVHHAIAAQLMTRDDVYAELHEILSGKKPGRVSDDEIIVLDSTGTAIQDVAAAAIAYRRAVEQGFGQYINLTL